VVAKTISLNHVQHIARRVQHRLLLWDNYPVNDLSMGDELHIGPLLGRDPRLPRSVYGYLNNPLLQEELAFVPLATCFDYAVQPHAYIPEASWTRIIKQRFGAPATPHWRTIRKFAEASLRAKRQKRQPRFTPNEKRRLRSALIYIHEHSRAKWMHELMPWTKQIERLID
jgi:hyaluronoglucosaminidase